MPGAVLFGHQVQGRCPGRVGAVKNTCFLQGEELCIGDMVLLRVQPLYAGEDRSCATCVYVFYNAVERFGGGSAGPQQHWDFLEQLL
jgi:hypothetical protein